MDIEKEIDRIQKDIDDTARRADIPVTDLLNTLKVRLEYGFVSR